MMCFLLLLVIALLEQVNLQGDEKVLILKEGAHPCEGHLQVFYQNDWGYVGDTGWSRSTEEVACRSTHCGKPVKNSIDMVFRPLDSKVWLNELSCNGNESHLWDCGNPGWEISHYRSDTVKTINCSNQIRFSLDGVTCAGAATYYTDENTAPGYFCGDNWTEKESALLCKYLGCGEHKEITPHPWFGWKKFQSSKKMTTKCVGTANLNNLWQCANQETQLCRKPASVICSDFKRLQLNGSKSNVCAGLLQSEEDGKWTPFTNKEHNLTNDWCKQMFCGTSGKMTVKDDGLHVTCAANIEIILRDKNEDSKCYGVVHVKSNGSSHPVCASTWSETEAKVVCNEKKCGKLISTSKVQKGEGMMGGVMDFVSCSGTESSLWHCRAKRDDQTFPCDSHAYVVCSESINVRLMDSPGRCAGRLEIQHEGRWQRVNKKGWTSSNSDVVCQHLKCGNERKQNNPEDKFSQGSTEFLTVKVNCKQNEKHISECFSADPAIPNQDQEPVSITCGKHKVVFLKGEESCSGMVGIEHGSNTYWLSGSETTWNKNLANTVCRQMNCEDASAFNSIKNNDTKTQVWNKAYSCLSNPSSVFECKETALPSDYNDTIATVTCTGKTTVNLTGACWGMVNICLGSNCGGVCNSTWTKEKSHMLCESLNCGHAVEDAKNWLKEGNVMIKSLHSTKHTKNLGQCNFIKNGHGENNCKEDAAFIVCSGSVLTRIKDTREKCTGNVEMFYEGQWLPVCKEALNKEKETANLICGVLGCGQALQTLDFFGPKLGALSVSQIKCANDLKSLRACNITSDMIPCTYAGLQCHDYKRMELKFNTSCSGALFVYSQGKRSAVSDEGWTETEGARLCEDLKCGNLSSISSIKTESNFWNQTFSCTGVKNPDSIWQCENPNPPKRKNQLFIQCQDEPKLTLSETCGGKVELNGISVCDTHWNIGYSHLVCQEMGCSNAVGNFSDGVPDSYEKYQHVMCEKYHSKLGQCKSFKAQCAGRLVSVYCVDHVKFNTTKLCGGQIQVKYRNDWENMCLASPLSPNLKNQLCVKLQCNGHNASIDISSTEKVSLISTLKCTNAHKDIKHCVSQKSCEGLQRAEIYCNGYVKESGEPDGKVPLIVAIMVGVGLLLVVVILAAVFVRLWIVKKDRKHRNAMPTQSFRENEFESEDYEDINDRPNEMENLKFGHGRSIPQPEVVMESDRPNSSSLTYDDIDDVAFETQPLTSLDATAGPASEDYYIPESDFNQSADGVAYEVDDPRENYDDIEAGPDISQTRAEVHKDPGPSPKAVPVAHQELMYREEDYLEPDQNG